MKTDICLICGTDLVVFDNRYNEVDGRLGFEVELQICPKCYTHCDNCGNWFSADYVDECGAN